MYQRVSVAIQRFDFVLLLHDSIVDDDPDQ